MFKIGTILKLSTRCPKDIANIGDLAIVVDYELYYNYYLILKSYLKDCDVLENFVCVEWLNSKQENGFYAKLRFSEAGPFDLIKVFNNV